MDNIIQFPIKNHIRKEKLLEMLVKALELNTHFLDMALWRGTFSKHAQEEDTVVGLIETNNTLLTESRRKIT